MPARDSREEQTDFAALPAAHQQYIEDLQARQHQMGLDVTVNRGRVYGAPGGDAAMADIIESRLAVSTVNSDDGDPYPVTVNRGAQADIEADAKRDAAYAVTQQRFTSDQAATPGSAPIAHDPMTPEQRRALTRRALAAYSDRRLDADQQVDGEPVPGVVRAPLGRTQLAYTAPDEGTNVVHADRVVPGPAPVLATSDTVKAVLRDEAIGAVEARRPQQVQDEADAVRDTLPQRSTDATVDAAGRTVTSEAYRDRVAAVRNARRSRTSPPQEGTQ